MKDLVVIGDSNVAIQQLRGNHAINVPGLQLPCIKENVALKRLKSYELVHVKREFNAAADFLAGKATQRRYGEKVESPDFADLVTLSRLHEIFTK